MKVRVGFVSNSSSSSYIVTIQGVTEDDIYEWLARGCCYTLLDRQRIENELENRVRIARERLADSDGSWGYTKRMVVGAEEYLNKFRQLPDKEAFARFQLDNEGTAVIDTKEGVQIAGSSVVHNDYGDMPPLFREILLRYLMETDHPVRARRIDES